MGLCWCMKEGKKINNITEDRSMITSVSRRGKMERSDFDMYGRRLQYSGVPSGFCMFVSIRCLRFEAVLTFLSGRYIVS